MLFRIAREVGGVTVEELEHRLSAEEFIEWSAIFKWEYEEHEKQKKEAEKNRKSKPRRSRRGR